MDNIPIDKRILKQLLKAGFIYKRQLFPTQAGTPQGGILSPIMANITLDGIERKIKEKYWKTPKGKTHHIRYNQHKVNYTRYADDFIVTANSIETLMEIKELITQHLNPRGLTLSEEKTLITNIDSGFDFLGWNFRKYNGKMYIKPSKSSIKKIKETIKTTINAHLGKSQSQLIKNLNPIITGWTNYHRTCCAKETFSQIDTYTFHRLWKWAKQRHRNKPKKWIRNRYWQRTLFRNWIFSDGTIQLKNASDTKITRHWIIKFDANPYLPEYQRYYYCRDMQRIQEKNQNVAANGIFGE